VVEFIDSEHLSVKSFCIIPKISFGCNAKKDLVSALNERGLYRPFIIADQGVYQAGLVKLIQDLINKPGVEIGEFHNISSEPTLESMNESTLAVREFKPDCIIGIGGGSSMDTAKVVAMVFVCGGDLKDYLEGKPYNARLPLFLVPTTAGTGSEVTGDSVFSVNKQKRWISHSCLVPDLSILDPELTVSLPKRVTASTGLDVLCHALEGLMTSYRNVLVEMHASKAVSLVIGNLEKAYWCGNDISARYNMMLAAMLGGIANNNAPATFPHSIGYTIANRFNVPHGFSCEVGLPAAMEFNLPMCTDEFSTVFDACFPLSNKKSKNEKASALIEEIKIIIQKVNGYSRLRDFGVEEDLVNTLAEECYNLFPRPYNICQHNLEDIKNIYRKIY